MTTIAQALKVLPALAMLGCVSDFSPDPYKVNPNTISATDAGSADAAVRDSGSTTPRDSGSTAPPPTTDAGPVMPTGDSGSTEPPPTGSGPCDLSGRWIMTEHNQSVAYGAEQVSLGMLYVEITQQGAALTVSRSMLCGTSTNEAKNPAQLFAVAMEDSRSWPAYQKQVNYDGRKGTSSEANGGCNVSFEKAPLVKGMTVATYKDEGVALPTAQQMASGATPGWEDWDGDGQPGITMTVSKAADANMYTAVRAFLACEGTTDANPTHFSLTSTWNQQRIVYGSDNSLPFVTQLLGSDAAQSTVPNSSFVEFARLSADQATGDDDAICAAIRTLSPMLNPDANTK